MKIREGDHATTGAASARVKQRNPPELRGEHGQGRVRGKTVSKRLLPAISKESGVAGLPGIARPQPRHRGKTGPARIPGQYCPGQASGRSGYHWCSTSSAAQSAIPDCSSAEWHIDRSNAMQRPGDRTSADTPARQYRLAIGTVADHACFTTAGSSNR